jgi:hypothetical protein
MYVFLEHLAHVNTTTSRAILVKVDRVADALSLDDELIDGLLAGLGLFRGEGQKHCGFDFAKVHDLLQ